MSVCKCGHIREAHWGNIAGCSLCYCQTFERVPKRPPIEAAFLDAIHGDDCPNLTRLSALETLLRHLDATNYTKDSEDPESMESLLGEVRDLAKLLRVAEAKAQGEQKS